MESLRVIDEGNRPAVERLRVAPEQEKFVDGVGRSLAEAAAKRWTWWWPTAHPAGRGRPGDQHRPG